MNFVLGDIETDSRLTNLEKLNQNGGKVLFKVMPNSCTFISGLAPSYSTRYSEKALGEYIEIKPFKRAIGRLNDVLFQFWPCSICYYIFGLFLGIFTCGLTCLLPYICIKDAKREIDYEVKALNKEIFHPKGLEIEYQGCCYWSCFRIKVLEEDEMTQLERSPLSYNSFSTKEETV
ncbi:unnamed protein product [Moneuplotes crassus]|uniref:Golgin subfamily A member 7/ERF4 domain-containing protein n=1 Tax=Euplotes crassus TaxID=5936 RepID=A0AAD1XR40_EUPCR|nr:unnamed protein product [Moneuplotes crassus]